MYAYTLALALAAGPQPGPAKPADTKALTKEAAKTDAKVEAKPEVLTRGDKLTGANVVTWADLMAAPSTFSGKTVTLEGTVRKACERKGCWMELAADDKAPGVRVTFKNYGFFVPLDSAGSRAKVEGEVKVAELTEAKAKHYESEGAKVAKDKDGTYREVQLVASGVELRK